MTCNVIDPGGPQVQLIHPGEVPSSEVQKTQNQDFLELMRAAQAVPVLRPGGAHAVPYVRAQAGALPDAPMRRPCCAQVAPRSRAQC